MGIEPKAPARGLEQAVATRRVGRLAQRVADDARLHGVKALDLTMGLQAKIANRGRN